MRKIIFATFFVMLSHQIYSQESQTDYNFLRLPVSAHAAALGGDNITIIEDDPTLIFNNPALASSVSDKTINLNYMTYMEGTKTASASYIMAIKERGTLGLSAQYMDYGDIKEVTDNNVETGTFSATDISLAGTFAYELGKHLVGGVTTKFITSHIAGYNSIAMGVDIGINYYNEKNMLSISAVARNLGGQLKAYNDEYENIPFDLQAGVTKKLANAPFRFSFTVVDLTHWDASLINHCVFGADIILSKTVYLAAGYNPRRNNEMKIEDSSHGAGWSFGGGLQLERFKLQISYGKYHLSSSSLLFNFSYNI
ncbi:MAG: type IX secretion system protein PorQ [Bacteroidaceae bacterium]|nr:type IX secretion system protein PorQ [Bacteroidaceae bacterium]